MWHGRSDSQTHDLAHGSRGAVRPLRQERDGWGQWVARLRCCLRRGPKATGPVGHSRVDETTDEVHDGT